MLFVAFVCNRTSVLSIVPQERPPSTPFFSTEALTPQHVSYLPSCVHTAVAGRRHLGVDRAFSMDSRPFTFCLHGV